MPWPFTGSLHSACCAGHEAPPRVQLVVLQFCSENESTRTHFLILLFKPMDMTDVQARASFKSIAVKALGDPLV